MAVFSKMLAMSLAVFFIFVPSVTFAEDTEEDVALWGGGLFLVEPDSGIDYSLEYQFRYSDDLDSLGSQFVEAMGYHKASPNVLLNGGYRFTHKRLHGFASHAMR